MPPPRSRVTAGSATSTMLLLRKATIDARTATTMTRVDGRTPGSAGRSTRVLKSCPGPHTVVDPDIGRHSPRLHLCRRGDAAHRITIIRGTAREAEEIL